LPKRDLGVHHRVHGNLLGDTPIQRFQRGSVAQEQPNGDNQRPSNH
jgi:hypothetical protein